MEPSYHYYAFISYATTDSKNAKWLQHQLSYYHIPTAVKKSQIGVPQKIRPIFIYEYDLSGNQLHKAIEQELEASKYLIVICSPSSAKSEYVNREVQKFIDLGRQDRIIPFIIDGKVGAENPAEECFPPALLRLLSSGNKEDELRGVSVATNGKYQALVDVVATMLGVRRDVLWNRYRARLRRQRLVCGVVAMLTLLMGLFYWDYTRPTYEYYADYVDVWGAPQGIIPLDKEQVKHRHGTYRFEYRRIPFGEPNAYDWRLAVVTHINSAGRPTTIPELEYTNRYPIQELTFSEQDGALTHITYCNMAGKRQIIHRLARRNGVPAAIVDLESALSGEATGFSKDLSILSDALAKKSMITRYAYTRNDDGYIVGVTFHANNGNDLGSSAVSDNSAVWGMEYELDSLGRQVAVHYIGKDGSSTRNKKGVASRYFTYDKGGQLCRCECRGQSGDLVANELGWAVETIVRDEYGNTLEEAYYDTDDKPCTRDSNWDNDGYAKCTYKYDNRGNIIEVCYYGVDGEPCLSFFGYAKYTVKRDRRGNEIERCYYGVDGEPCLSIFDYAKRTSKYDDRGNRIERCYYGVDGEPCMSSLLGYAKCTYKYDDRGNEIECCYYGVDGEPCLIDEGYAKYTSKYDDRGNRIERCYYGVDGEPCLIDEGYAKYTSKYDDRGNEIEVCYYGVDGKPCTRDHDWDNDGYAKCTYKYDDRGNEIEVCYYGVDGEPCLIDDGYAKYTSKYDDRGNEIEVCYYGVDGELCLIDEGFAKYTSKYDNRGNEIEVCYYGVDGKPCLHNGGYAKRTSKYNDRGNIEENYFYGVDGKPCLHNGGYAKCTSKYDNRGNIIERCFYGVDGKPCLHKNGYAKFVWDYNAGEATYYDENGNDITNQINK